MSAATIVASSGWIGEAPCSTRSPRIASSVFVTVGPDRDPRVARVGAVHADLALADLERPPHQQDAIEDLGKQERVDDVAADLDLLDHARRDSLGSRRPPSPVLRSALLLRHRRRSSSTTLAVVAGTALTSLRLSRDSSARFIGCPLPSRVSYFSSPASIARLSRFCGGASGQVA